MGSAGRSTLIYAFVACVSIAAGRRQRNRPIWLKRSVASPLLGYAHRPVHATPRWRETCSMMVIGIDAHKRSHTAVTVDEMGR